MAAGRRPSWGATQYDRLQADLNLSTALKYVIEFYEDDCIDTLNLIPPGRQSDAAIDALIGNILAAKRVDVLSPALDVLIGLPVPDNEAEECYNDLQYERLEKKFALSPSPAWSILVGDPIIRADILAIIKDQNNQDTVDQLITAIINADSKASLIAAITNFGLDPADAYIAPKVANLFGELQYDKVANQEPPFDGPEYTPLQPIIININPFYPAAIKAALNAQPDLSSAKKLIDDAINPAAEKSDLKNALALLGLTNDDAFVKQHFAEIQFNRLSHTTLPSGKPIQWMTTPPNDTAVKNKLADMTDVKAVDAAVEAIFKAGLPTDFPKAMNDFGFNTAILSPAEINDSFAALHFDRICNEYPALRHIFQDPANSANLKNALIALQTPDAIDDAVKKLTMASDKASLQAAMTALNLDLKDANQLAAELQYNRLSKSPLLNSPSYTGILPAFKDGIIEKISTDPNIKSDSDVDALVYQLDGALKSGDVAKIKSAMNALGLKNPPAVDADDAAAQALLKDYASKYDTALRDKTKPRLASIPALLQVLEDRYISERKDKDLKDALNVQGQLQNYVNSLLDEKHNFAGAPGALAALDAALLKYRDLLDHANKLVDKFKLNVIGYYGNEAEVVTWKAGEDPEQKITDAIANLGGPGAGGAAGSPAAVIIGPANPAGASKDPHTQPFTQARVIAVSIKTGPQTKDEITGYVVQKASSTGTAVRTELRIPPGTQYDEKPPRHKRQFHESIPSEKKFALIFATFKNHILKLSDPNERIPFHAKDPELVEAGKILCARFGYNYGPKDPLIEKQAYELKLCIEDTPELRELAKEIPRAKEQQKIITPAIEPSVPPPPSMRGP